MRFPLASAFLALPLEEEDGEAFTRLHEALLSWKHILFLQDPGSAHLTLNYWKSLMEIEYRNVLHHAEAMAKKRAPFSVPITGVDTFGRRGEESVLFLSVGFSPPLAGLKKSLPWPNERPFHPHITLARIRHPQMFSVKKKAMISSLLRVVPQDVSFDKMRLYATREDVPQVPLADIPFSDFAERPSRPGDDA